MASPAPLIAAREGVGPALQKLLGEDLIEHIFAVGEDSITVRREAVAGVMVMATLAAAPKRVSIDLRSLAVVSVTTRAFDAVVNAIYPVA